MAIMACCLGLISLLNYYNFCEDLEEFINSRFMVVAQDLKNSVEYGLNLGLGLAELKNMQPLLTAAHDHDPDISNLMVVDADNNIIFHSDATRDGQSAPPDNQSNSRILALALVNQFNVRVGTLRLSYPNTLITIPQAAMRRFLFRRLLIILAGAALLTLLLVMILTKGMLRGCQELANNLERLVANDPLAGKPLTDPELAPAYAKLVATVKQQRSQPSTTNK